MSIESPRQRLQGGLVHLVNGCPSDAEFRGDRVDRVLGDVDLYPAVRGDVWADVALVVSLNFVTGTTCRIDVQSQNEGPVKRVGGATHRSEDGQRNPQRVLSG